MDVGAVVDEQIDPIVLEKMRTAYEDQAKRGGIPSAVAQISYAHALIRSKRDDVRLGIFLLEDLLNRDTEDVPKRDYVYYLAVAHTRLKSYDRALDYINVLLSAESDNRQAVDLKELIHARMQRDGFIGLAVLGFGGGAAIVAGALALGALLKKK